MIDASPLARIGLRILGGFLVGRGLATEDSLWIFSDPEFVGLVALALSEVWYLVAKKMGWAT
jgi:hypothetical protein